MKLDFLGGAMEIGGSSIFLQIADKNILLDAGLRQGSGKDPIPNFRVVQEKGGLDAIVISHAHLDHIGCLPMISKEYPHARIYMNHMTKDLVRVLLFDSLKVMNRREEEIPFYAENDVISTLDRIFPLHYENSFSIFPDIDLTLYPAGHIAGASCVYIQTKEGTLFYSGDFSSFSQKAIEGAKIPKLRPDVAIIESTYGDKLHSNRQVEEKELIRLVNECYEKNGKMLIPAFALGRSQEVILILKSAINKGLIPAIPIYVDGMVRDINTAFIRNPLYLKNSISKRILRGMDPFYDDHIVAVKPTDNKEELVNKPGSAIFVSSSGMLTGGPSIFYAQMLAPMENGYIVITGYQDEESPGRKILELMEETGKERSLNIDGRSIPVTCIVKKVGLSAHGDKGEIKGLIEKLSSRNIFLVHGDPKVIENLGSEISREFIGKIYAPECGESYSLDIRNPRKQWKKQFPYTMQKPRELKPEDCRELWEYIRDHYADKALTIAETCYIWSGKKTVEDEILLPVQTLLLDSVYFESDIKRGFLLRARTEEDVEKDLAPKEWKHQELEPMIQEYFSEYPYKKISFQNETKSIVLNFDFPHIISHMEEKQIAFKLLTGWDVTMNKNMNNSAASIVLQQLFSDRLKKVSFFNEERRVKAELHQNDGEDAARMEEFRKITGWKLSILGGKSGIQEEDHNSLKQYMPSGKVPVMEQNHVFSYIDTVFAEEKHRPYKKSIKTDGAGKYIELAFISPMVGERYESFIRSISEETGWRFAIATNVNLNEILNQVKILCNQHGMILKKNPSYQNGSRSVEITIVEGGEFFEPVKEMIMDMTGCLLVVK